MKLIQALGLDRARVVSICGAGGKTSLMFALARAWVAAGERVLVTTTTKIATAEAEGPWPVVTADWADAAGPAVIAVSGPAKDGSRLVGIAPEIVDELRARSAYDRIVVEADGAADRPLKAPADHEPVIPSATDNLVIVAGLNGLGLPLNEDSVFRSDLWTARTGLAPGAPVTADSLAQMVIDDNGLAKGCPAGAERALFLNRADHPARLLAARTVADILTAAPANRPTRVVAGWLRPTPAIAFSEAIGR
jgi:probable selenium-dependent hydroxylase accessory protein YqeC